ncbi:hypothetical protein ACIREE_41615 [Streptomyces sp. NPDC102467]|uniref:hypothetical protein n=1 Tax=Streptomyces sp. NPDC102467 TaxID=3366179 RepID=UPI00380E51F6
MSKVRSRVVALVTAVAALSGAAVTMGSGTASASDAVFEISATAADGSRTIKYYTNSSSPAGVGQWQANGDTLIAKDLAADGFGFEARLSTGRVASTRGLNSPVTVKKTGDLPEGNWYTLQLCRVKGTNSYCSGAYSVHA